MCLCLLKKKKTEDLVLTECVKPTTLRIIIINPHINYIYTARIIHYIKFEF